MVADISVVRFIFINLESLQLLCEQAGWLCGNLFLPPMLRVPVLVIAHVLVELGLVQSVLPDMLIGSHHSFYEPAVGSPRLPLSQFAKNLTDAWRQMRILTGF